MRVKSLLTNTRKSLKKCSKLLKQFKDNTSPQVAATLYNSLKRELVFGESLEHELFQLCETEKVSPNQLKLLGQKTTFSEWRRNNDMRRYEQPMTSYTNPSQESPTLQVLVPQSPTTTPNPPASPHTLTTLMDMSDPSPWLAPRHLRRLFRPPNPSPPNESTPPTNTPASTTGIRAPNTLTEMIKRVQQISKRYTQSLESHP